MSAAKVDFSMIHPPKGWAKASLGAVVWSVSSKADPAENRNAHYVGLEHIVSGESRLRGVGKASDVKSTKSKFQRGDILYGKLRPYLNKVATPEFAGICSTDILVLRPENEIENGFVEAVLRTDQFIDFATKSSSGINLPRTSFEKIASFEFWVAPSNEQTRIAAKLRRLLERGRKLRQQLEELPALIQQYRAAVLEAACTGRLVPTEAELAGQERRDFEPASVLLERILVARRTKWEADQLAKMRAAGKEPKDDKWREKYPRPQTPDGIPGFSLPKGWCFASAEQLTDALKPISYGVIQLGKDVSDGVPVLRSSNVRNLKLDLDVVKRVSTTIAKAYERTFLEGNEVLITVRGTLGGVCVLNDQANGYNVSREIAVLSLIEPPIGRAIAAFIASGPLSGWLTQRVTGVAQQGINISDLRRLPVPLPPIREMDRIADQVEQRLSALDRIEEQVRTALEQTSQLRVALFHRALSGKLVEQRKTDEPAEQLLARICIERKKRLQVPKRVRPQRKAKMKKLSSEVVKDAILKLPKDRFSFDELSTALQADYDPLKDIVFELLDEPKPPLRQVFDSKAKTMQLERIKP